MNDASAPPAPSSEAGTAAPATFAEALGFWLKLGFISFGGPAGQIALMHEELVVRRRWISQRRFQHALNFCMLLPGPEAQQLATYLGWLMHRTWGGLAAGVLFVLPSLLLLIALSWAYLRFGQLPSVAALLWGLKPAVVALVLLAAWRLGQRTLVTPALKAVALGAFVALGVLDAGFPWVIGAAAILGWALSRWRPALLGSSSPGGATAASAPGPRAWLDDHTPLPAHAQPSRARTLRIAGVVLLLWACAWMALRVLGGEQGPYTRMASFFTQAALLTFGGAYAVLPYVLQGAVEQHGWLSAAQMMDGLALGETTPGPLIMVVAFVGFLGGWQQQALGPQALAAAGMLGAVVATFFTFLPSFLFILAGAPMVESTREQPRLAAPLAAITAAVVGVIASLGLFFATHTFWPGGLGPGAWAALDGPALLLAAAAGLALWRWRAGTVPVLGACALAGWLLRAA